MSALTLAELAQDKQIPEHFLKALGLRDSPDGVAIPYFDESGNPLFERIRLSLHVGRRFHQPAGVSLVPYGLDRLEAARQSGKSLILVEGESDSWTLWLEGFYALGLPGASTASKLERSHLRGIERIFVVREPGSGGDAFISGIVKRLSELGFDGEAYEVSLNGFKDPNELYCDDPDRFADRFRDALQHVSLLPAFAEDQPGVLRVFDVQELLSVQLPPRQFVLEPIFRERDSMMIFSWRGVGKTLLGLSLANAIATGGECLGWRAPKPRRVLYIDGELPLQTLQERVASLVGDNRFDPTYLKFLTHDAQERGLPDLGTLAGQDRLRSIIEPAEVVFFDSISTLVRSGKENEAEGWMPVQDYLLRLRKDGKESILLHHEGKTGTQRGTSKREDILDAVIHLKRPSGYSATEGARFEVHFEKCRAIVGESAKTFEARLDTTRVPAVWARHEIEAVNLTRVTEMTNLGMSVRDIAEELKMSKSAVGRLRKQVADMSQRPDA